MGALVAQIRPAELTTGIAERKQQLQLLVITFLLYSGHAAASQR